MIDTRSILTVLKDDNGTFTDMTLKAADYLRDPFSMALDPTTDRLYLGYKKPFGAAYVELETASGSDAGLTAEYYDGAAWQSLDLSDETAGLTRSGFIFWDKIEMEKATVDGKEKFYIRLRTASEVATLEVKGINIVFTGTQQMKQEFFEVDSEHLLPAGATSHIGTLVATRDRIVQRLRNMGYQKTVASVDEMIDQWDLIDIFEVRQGATFLALATLFFNLSSSPDDHWWQKYQDYTSKFEEMMRLAHLSIDKDGDGVDDSDEIQEPIKCVRWNR